MRSFVRRVASWTASDDYGNKTKGRRKGGASEAQVRRKGIRRSWMDNADVIVNMKVGRRLLLLRGCKREASEKTHNGRAIY